MIIDGMDSFGSINYYEPSSPLQPPLMYSWCNVVSGLLFCVFPYVYWQFSYGYVPMSILAYHLESMKNVLLHSR